MMVQISTRDMRGSIRFDQVQKHITLLEETRGQDCGASSGIPVALVGHRETEEVEQG